MPSQRACAAESQARNTLSNGPLRAQSNGVSRSILRREAGVTCRGYDGILQRARIFRESRWHRELSIFVLDRSSILSRTFCALSESTRTAGGRRDRTDGLAGTRFPARRKDGTGSGRSPRCECRAHVHRASSAREGERTIPGAVEDRSGTAERTYTERAPLARVRGTIYSGGTQ